MEGWLEKINIGDMRPRFKRYFFKIPGGVQASAEGARAGASAGSALYTGPSALGGAGHGSHAVVKGATHVDYYTSDDQATHRGVVYLTHCRVSEVDTMDPDAKKVSSELEGRSYPFKFVDSVTGKTHFFNAPGLAEKERWMRAAGGCGAGGGGGSGGGGGGGSRSRSRHGGSKSSSSSSGGSRRRGGGGGDDAGDDGGGGGTLHASVAPVVVPTAGAGGDQCVPAPCCCPLLLPAPSQLRRAYCL